MKVQEINRTIQLGVVIAFLLMVAVNFLANLLPINGVTTAEVSDSYANLFTPAGYTFAIWGLIYLLLALYVLFQMGFLHKKENMNPPLMNKIGRAFIVSSGANIAWIFSWHFKAVPLSMIWMIVILLCLILIAQTLRRERLSSGEKFFLRIPFSVYFGWITVATIANVTALLVYWGWGGWGLPETLWTVIVLLAGVAIGGLTMLRSRNMAYGLVLIWAYIGILVRHAVDLGGQYPAVMIGASLSIALLMAATVVLLREKWSNRLPVE